MLMEGGREGGREGGHRYVDRGEGEGCQGTGMLRGREGDARVQVC